MTRTPSSAPVETLRRPRETRVLKLVVACLAVVTALVSLPLFAVFGTALLVVPFVVMVGACALVLPLDGFAQRAVASSARLQQHRRAESERHAFTHNPRSDKSTVGRAELGLLRSQEAMAAATAHGIHFASGHLSDEEFRQRFTGGELRAGDFRHGDHLRFAWIMLERLPFEMAEESIAQVLRVFLRRISGSHAQFHATHTHGWVRVLAALPERTFADVLFAHPERLHSTALTRYWSPDLLSSDAARSAAIATDLAPLPPPVARRVRRYRQGNTSLPPAPHAPVLLSRKEPGLTHNGMPPLG